MYTHNEHLFSDANKLITAVLQLPRGEVLCVTVGSQKLIK